MAASSSPTTSSSNPNNGQTYIDQLSSVQTDIQKIQETTGQFIVAAQHLQEMHPGLLHLIQRNVQRNTPSDMENLQQRVQDLTSILNKIGATHNEGVNLSSKQEKEAPEIFAKVADLIEKKDLPGAREKITEARKLKLVLNISEQCDAFVLEIEKKEQVEQRKQELSAKVDGLLDYDNFANAKNAVQKARDKKAPEAFCLELEKRIQEKEDRHLDDQSRFDAVSVDSAVYKGQLPTSSSGSSSPEPAPVDAEEAQQVPSPTASVSDEDAHVASNSPTQSQSASSEEENLMLAAAEMLGEETGSREKIEEVLAQYGHVEEIADFCNSLLIAIADAEEKAAAQASRPRSSSEAEVVVATPAQQEPAPVVRERSATVAPQASAMAPRPTRPAPKPVQAAAAPTAKPTFISDEQRADSMTKLNTAKAKFNNRMFAPAKKAFDEINREALNDLQKKTYDKLKDLVEKGVQGTLGFNIPRI